MTPQKHATGGAPSPELTSELKTLKTVVEGRQDRSPEGMQALGTIESALEAAEAGKADEARSIVQEAWGWIKENLSLDGLSEHASDLGDTLTETASELGEKVSKGWSSLFGDDHDAADAAADDSGDTPSKRA